MTVFIEVSNPPQWRPWSFKSRIMYRFGWAWFAIGVLRIPFKDFTALPWDWSE
jgi:hypothetical protein